MKTLISVDWDYFVPEKPEWDFGHQENLLFLKMLWSTRGYAYNDMKTTGEEAGFWDKLRAKARLYAPLWVSDSHAFVYSLLRGVNRVVLFDAHHDCWPSDRGGESKGGVYCHDWLRVWLKGSKKRSAVWVKPDWQDSCTLPDDMRGRVSEARLSEGSKWGLEGSVTVHVCRSGCWTPPWLDRAFLGFLSDFGGGLDAVARLQDGEWDATKERWTEADLAACLETERQMTAMRRDLLRKSETNVIRGGRSEVVVGTIPSTQFANCKVEQRAP